MKDVIVSVQVVKTSMNKAELKRVRRYTPAEADILAAAVMGAVRTAVKKHDVRSICIDAAKD